MRQNGHAVCVAAHVPQSTMWAHLLEKCVRGLSRQMMHSLEVSSGGGDAGDSGDAGEPHVVKLGASGWLWAPPPFRARARGSHC